MMLSYENRSTMGQPIPAAADYLDLPMTTSSSSNSLTNGASSRQPSTNLQHIWIVTGPAGCGKSTVAQYAAKAMNLPYIEGDEFHPQSNIDKMAKGIPLTDADRWDWLIAVREESRNRLTFGSQGVVLACSALKRKYRDVIRVASYFDRDLRLHFVSLYASEEVLLARVGARKGHYMGANMVHSQFGILEAPDKDEMDIISVDASGSIEEVEKNALAKMHQAMQKS